MSDQLRELESVQLYIVQCDDIQEVMMDISYGRQLLQDILSSPHDQSRRVVPARDVREGWVRRLLHTLGFLPEGRSALILTDDALDPHLLHSALSILTAVELAISRSAIPIQTSGLDEDEGMEMEFEGDVTFQPHSQSHDHSSPVKEPMTFRRRSSSSPLSPDYAQQVSSSSQTGLTGFTGYGAQWPSLSTSVPTPISPAARMLSHQGDSQESYWSHFTAGSLSTQSSQEECPEEVGGEGPPDYSSVHRVVELASSVSLREAKKYKAAAEFCKLSGLLCSYGLYQIVCHEQLVLYCRGNTTSFSARVMALDGSGRMGVSSW